MMRSLRWLLAAALASAAISPAAARDSIRIVGSSTVYPFAAVVAERFGRLTAFKTPVLEATGSGGGIKLFCDGLGADTPDIVNASRRIEPSELLRCRRNGVQDIVEIKIGYDGIVIGSADSAPRMDLSLKALYLALAVSVPAPAAAARFVDNPYQTWRDVDPSLPAQPIRVMGPPPTSGTRDAFVELALEGGCRQYAWIEALERQDPRAYRARCHGIRQDGAYIEAGENDNLIVRKLLSAPERLGIFGYSFLINNEDTVQAALIDGVEPTFENIVSGRYPVSRSLYCYVKKAHVPLVPGIDGFLRELTSRRAIGPEGYLVRRGLIPLADEEREAVALAARQLTSFNGF